MERAGKVGQETSESFQKRLSFSVFASQRSRSRLSPEVEILIGGLTRTFKEL